MAIDPASIGISIATALASIGVSIDKWVDVSGLKAAVKTAQDEVRLLRDDYDTLASSFKKLKETPAARNPTGSHPAIDDSFDPREIQRKIVELERWREECRRADIERAKDDAERVREEARADSALQAKLGHLNGLLDAVLRQESLRR